MAVVRERKLAEPLAPNRLPEAPLPKAAPTSAPLPCWSRTRPMMQSATMTSTMRISVNQKSILHSPELSPRPSADGDDILRHERSPADQSAVDVGHRQQFGGVVGLDAAAVQDRHVPRERPVARSEPRTDKRVHVLSLLGRRVPARADRPNRFVSEHGACQRGDSRGGEDRIELATYYVFGLTALAPLYVFSHAYYRRQAVPPGRNECGRDSVIVY